jgi:uncharacterized protein (DUF983 family)
MENLPEEGDVPGRSTTATKRNRRSPKTPAVPSGLYTGYVIGRNPGTRFCHSFWIRSTRRLPGYPSQRMARGAAPSPVRLLARALTRRCPWCGRGRLFRGWFRIVERCPRCGLRFEREEGAFLGAMALNYGVAGVVFMAVLIGWMVIDSPDVRVVPLMVISMSVTGAVVLLFYPFSKTLWAAVDVLLNRMDRGDAETFRGPLR